MDDSFSKATFLACHSDDARAELIEQLQAELSARLERATDFEAETRARVDALRSVGHDLWSFDEQPGRSAWCPNWVESTGPGIVVEFSEPHSVTVQWSAPQDSERAAAEPRSVVALWSAIEAELDRLNPDLRSRLAPGATDEELTKLEDDLGFALPLDLMASMRRHAGGRVRHDVRGRPYSTMLMSDLGLLAPDVLAATRSWLLDNYSDLEVSPHGESDPKIDTSRYWHRRWIPFAMGDEDRSLFWCVDCAPSAHGTMGQIIIAMTNDDDRMVSHPNIRTFLADVLRQLRETAGEDPEEPGHFRLHGEF